MGICTYCGENAGFLRKTHKQCENINRSGWSEMIQLVANTASGDTNPTDLVEELGSIAKKCYINEGRIQSALLTGWTAAVDQAIDDHFISNDEENRLTQFAEDYSLSKSELNAHGAYERLVQGTVIRDITEGIIPSKQSIEGNIPFNLQKSEQLIWVFQNAPYYEYRTRRERVGRSSGFSIPVVKGVYYHTGGFKSHYVEKSATEYVDTGLVGITNKHIYFSGSTKSFRINYNKIVSFEPYADGIGIMRDAASAKPQTFTTGNGWFIYNLVTNLAQSNL